MSKGIAAALAALCLWMLGASTHAAAPTEYQVKAVFLFNFAQFVEWPAQAFTDARSPLWICVLGKDPFGADLDRIAQGESAQNRPIAVARYPDAKSLGACHILFVSESEAERLPEVLTSLRGRRVLTVSDVKDFARAGGMIAFVTQNNRVRLRVSLDTAAEERIAISSKLLRVAEIVPRGGK